MGKVNVCLKYVFFLLNGLAHVFGWFMFIVAVSSSTEMSVFLWIVMIGIICFSGLGIYGGCTENALALVVFAGATGFGIVFMLISGFMDVRTRQQVQDAISKGWIDLTKEEAEFVDEVFQITFGIYFGFAAAAVMNLVMSIMMICQISATTAEEPHPSACNREPPETQSL